MGKHLIDSNSLMSLVRYYHPFDKDERLMNFVRHNFEEDNWLLLDSVRNEIKQIAKGIVITTYSFLENEINSPKMVTEIKPVTVIESIHPNIDNSWVIHSRKKELESEEDYLKEKDKEIEKADFQLILTAMKDKDTYTIVTEETKASNDGKLFKKIPMICEQEGIDCITLPDLLLKFNAPFSVK